jgi:co-chaperonin GroES (HSP10)
MIIPVLHRVLVKPQALDEVNEDAKYAKRLGLQLAGINEKLAQASVDQGIVIDIGSTAFKDFGTDSPIKVGDKIAFARHSGKHIKDTNGDEYLLLNDEDVVCILKDSND